MLLDNTSSFSFQSTADKRKDALKAIREEVRRDGINRNLQFVPYFIDSKFFELIDVATGSYICVELNADQSKNKEFLAALVEPLKEQLIKTRNEILKLQGLA